MKNKLNKFPFSQALKNKDLIKNKLLNIRNLFLSFNKTYNSEKYQKLLIKFLQFKNQESGKTKSKKNKKEITKSRKNYFYENSQKLLHNFIKFNRSKLKFKLSNESKSIIFKSINRINNLLKNNKLSASIKNIKIINEKFLFSTNKKNEKYNQTVGTIFYSDHNIIFGKLNFNFANNKINFKAVTEISIPANIIGDSIVEDINELANISLDALNLIDLVDEPLLIVLSSSFFNIHTFLSSDLKQISSTDKQVQAKSPYLPANTHVEFRKISQDKTSNEFIRTTYANKDFIKSWTDTLEIIDFPIIGLVPASPIVFEAITNKLNEKLTVLIDIESLSTTVLIGSKFEELNSFKLPFGFSLYLSNDLKVSSANYFERVFNSISLLLKQSNQTPPKNIFVMGHGMDNLISDKAYLPAGFKQIAELNLSDYSYSPKEMNIHELISNSINSNVESLASILRSCL
tara:strand:- start:263 stop:1639 length:1377 start_codon:yes stop_codon:yes gene_type:complete